MQSAYKKPEPSGATMSKTSKPNNTSDDTFSITTPSTRGVKLPVTLALLGAPEYPKLLTELAFSFAFVWFIAWQLTLMGGHSLSEIVFVMHDQFGPQMMALIMTESSMAGILSMLWPPQICTCRLTRWSLKPLALVIAIPFALDRWGGLLPTPLHTTSRLVEVATLFAYCAFCASKLLYIMETVVSRRRGTTTPKSDSTAFTSIP